MGINLTSSIVLYKNDREILLKAINSYLHFNSCTKLFLVDNSPTDDLKYLISDIRIEYIHNHSNTGFGAGHNIAINKSIEIGAKYHVVLNPDVYFDAGLLEVIIEFMDKNSDVGNLMPKVCYPDGSNQFLCKLLPTPYDWIGRRFNPFKKIVEKRNNKFELRFTNYDRIMEVPYLSGCFMFLRLEALKEIGLFDEGIFMYGEETDLCRRLIANKYKTIYFPHVKIFHEFEKGSHKSLRLTWIGIKSAIYYFNKWGWFFDTQREKINKNSLKKLGFNKKS
jgi:GT2 family glycosyltransferase